MGDQTIKSEEITQDKEGPKTGIGKRGGCDDADIKMVEKPGTGDKGTGRVPHRIRTEIQGLSIRNFFGSLEILEGGSEKLAGALSSK